MAEALNRDNAGVELAGSRSEPIREVQSENISARAGLALKPHRSVVLIFRLIATSQMIAMTARQFTHGPGQMTGTIRSTGPLFTNG